MLVYIKPLSLFPQLHSDTIFGAICSAISEIYPEKIDEMIEEFTEKAPFTLTSAFPYIKVEERIIRFYPKLMTTSNSDLKLNLTNIKKYKKIKYIEEEIFQDFTSGKINEADIINNIDDYSIYNNLLFKEEYNLKYTYNENIIPQNTINRLDNTSENIFYTKGYEFKNSGLYFIINFNNNNYKDIVKSAIKFLKDRGFGKDISTGKGQFDYKIEEIEIDEIFNQNNGNYFTTLSRYIPTKQEIQKINKGSAYEISSKRGRSSSGEIRKQIKFFTEGSTFPYYQKYYGQIIKSGIETPAVEYGYAFTVRYNKNE